MHVARRQQIRDVGSPAPSADLLIVAEREIAGAPGLGPHREEVLHRLENPYEAPLVVQCAPAPHVASGDPPLERRLGPAALRSKLDGYHVLMCEQDDRGKIRIGPRPLVQQTVPVHLLEFERGMEPGERRPQVPVEPVELTGIELGRVLIGNGLEAQGAGQALSERRGVERLHHNRSRLKLARAEGEGALERDGGEDQDPEEDGADDHSGNHGRLAEERRITPLAHASAVSRLALADTHPRLYRRVAWGARTPALTAPLGERLETPRFRFQVIHTPGHATDHVALFEPERGWLFSGDLYLAPRLRYLRADEDVYAMMDSLRRVLALEPRVLFCQHRGRVEQGAARLRDKLDFLVELGERIHELHGRGWSDAAIARALPGSDFLWRVWTGGDFSKRNFVRAFLRTASAR